jgi:hypothetical protein
MTIKPKRGDMTIMTIVARDPNSVAPLDADDRLEAPTSNEGDSAIYDVMSKLCRRSNRDVHRVMRASSVEEIHILLQQYPAPELLQIIGHGTIGMLCLGSRWNGMATGKLTYVIDSDPKVYGLLVGLVGSQTRVRMLGCAVGSATEVEEGRPADGATFVFDLARMWRCEVGAAVDVISAGDFCEESGLFEHEHRLMTSSGEGMCRPSGEPRLLVGNRKPETVELQYPHGLSRHARAAVEGLFSQLSQVKVSPVATRGLLAAPEAVFQARWSDKAWRAEIIANGTLLHLMDIEKGAEDDGHYFRFEDESSTAIRAYVARVTAPAV